jgi:hypothetical protein
MIVLIMHMYTMGIVDMLSSLILSRQRYDLLRAIYWLINHYFIS